MARFEETMLFFVDAYNLHSPGSQESLIIICQLNHSFTQIEFTPASDKTTPEFIHCDEEVEGFMVLIHEARDAILGVWTWSCTRE